MCGLSAQMNGSGPGMEGKGLRGVYCCPAVTGDGGWGALGVRGGGRVALWDEWSVGRGRGFGAGRGDGAVLAPSDTSSGRCWVVGTAPPICVFEKVSKYGASDWLGL